MWLCSSSNQSLVKFGSRAFSPLSPSLLIIFSPKHERRKSECTYWLSIVSPSVRLFVCPFIHSKLYHRPFLKKKKKKKKAMKPEACRLGCGDIDIFPIFQIFCPRVCMDTPPSVHAPCRGGVACVLLRSQELCRQEPYLMFLAGPTNRKGPWRRGQRKRAYRSSRLGFLFCFLAQG